MLSSASGEICVILAGICSSGSASTRTRTSFPTPMRPRSISSTLASITSELMSGISARFIPEYTLSPTLNGLAFSGPWL